MPFGIGVAVGPAGAVGLAVAAGSHAEPPAVTGGAVAFGVGVAVGLATGVTVELLVPRGAAMTNDNTNSNPNSTTRYRRWFRG